MKTYVYPLYNAPIEMRPAIWIGAKKPSAEQQADIKAMGFRLHAVKEGVELAKAFSSLDSTDKDRKIVTLECLVINLEAKAVFIESPTVVFLAALLKAGQSMTHEGDKLREVEMYAHSKGNEWLQISGHIE